MPRIDYGAEYLSPDEREMKRLGYCRNKAAEILEEWKEKDPRHDVEDQSGLTNLAIALFLKGVGGTHRDVWQFVLEEKRGNETRSRMSIYMKFVCQCGKVRWIKQKEKGVM